MAKSHLYKHQRLVKSNGWDGVPLCVEVGTRGYNDTLWGAMSKAIGLNAPENKRLRSRVAQVAQRCICYNGIYLSRKNQDWFKRALLEYK